MVGWPILSDARIPGPVPTKYTVSSRMGPTQAEDHHIILYLSGKAGYGSLIHGNNVRKSFSLAEPNSFPGREFEEENLRKLVNYSGGHQAPAHAHQGP